MILIKLNDLEKSIIGQVQRHSENIIVCCFNYNIQINIMNTYIFVI